jgi:hypothetical protein
MTGFTGVNAWGVSLCVAGILIVAHQYYLDEVLDGDE